MKLMSKLLQLAHKNLKRGTSDLECILDEGTVT